MQISVATTVDASPERVFAVATAIPRWPEVIRGIGRVEILTPGAVAMGTRFRETRVMYGREATEEMTVAELDPPKSFVLTAENHGTRYRAEHTFVPDGRGTRLTMTFSGKPVTLLARLFMPLGLLMAGSLKRTLEADLADLKRAAERD